MDNTTENMPYQGIPNPGSQEAIDAGCTCPVIANNYGIGVPDRVTGEREHYLNPTCSLHCAVEAQL